MTMSVIRSEFPALAVGRPGEKTVFFDGAAGTQICAKSLARMTEAAVDRNANFGGLFETSKRAGELVGETRAALADFLHANDPSEIIFGQNMTTLTLAMARTLGRALSRGDEIVLTRMDHDANVAPWLSIAEDRGLAVKWLDFNTETFEYDLAQLDELFTPATRLVALNYASNVIGTINDVGAITARAKEASPGVFVFVDAVQYAPHGVIDVERIGCDFLVCSAYKFYGPHYGILWGHTDVLRELQPYKVRTAPDEAPDKFETGTKSREAIGGVLGALEHFEALGSGNTRRDRLVTGMNAVIGYERALTEQLIGELKTVPGVTIHGITNKADFNRRVPTVAITLAGKRPADIATQLGAQGINVWHGHNYGWEPVKRLGLLEQGGVVRISLAQYNTAGEVERFLDALRRL